MSTCAHKPTGVRPDATDPSTSRNPGLSKECWSNAFGTFDRDGDGVITANDLNGQSRSKGEGDFQKSMEKNTDFYEKRTWQKKTIMV